MRRLRFFALVISVAVTFVIGLFLGWRGGALLFRHSLTAAADRWAVAAAFAGALAAAVGTFLVTRQADGELPSDGGGISQNVVNSPQVSLGNDAIQINNVVGAGPAGDRRRGRRRRS